MLLRKGEYDCSTAHKLLQSIARFCSSKVLCWYIYRKRSVGWLTGFAVRC